MAGPHGGQTCFQFDPSSLRKLSEDRVVRMITYLQSVLRRERWAF